MSPEVRHQIWAGLRQGASVGLVLAVLLGATLALWRSHDRADALTAVDAELLKAPEEVLRIARWSVSTRDHGGAPFAVIDKRRAHLYVVSIDGVLLGESPILLGYAPGDHTVPGIGRRPLAEVLPQERTTPAGRFEVRPGRNDNNEPVIWVDYDEALSMHRVRELNATERRVERLATPGWDDNRISYGCVNVPAAFFDAVVWPLLAEQRSVLYILPEIEPFDRVFPAARAWGDTASGQTSIHTAPPAS